MELPKIKHPVGFATSGMFYYITANAFHFVDGANVANEYTYDKNGTLTKDLNRNISTISYNFLNLPHVISFGDGNTVTYVYDGFGVRLSVSYKSGSTTTKTDYVGNKVYNNGTLSMIQTEEGYVTISGTTPTYYYYLKDHQGNNRVVINQSGGVQQVNHYYAFGGLFGEGLQTANQPYRYNGKELDRFQGLNMYDYGARHYDATLARWFTVDPLAEKYYFFSPYVYCANNPIRYIDPDGRDIWIYYDDADGYQQKIKYTQGMKYKGGNEFVSTSVKYLNQMSSTKSGSLVLGDLISSKNAFNMTNTFTKDKAGNDVKGALAFAGSDAGGGQIHAGELLNVKLTEGAKLESTAHELFHGYQHENGQGGASIFNEVEAMVFGVSVSLQYSYDNMTIGGGSSTPLGKDNSIGRAYQDGFQSLLYSPTFPQNAFVTAVKNFKQGAEKNTSGGYNNYPLRRPNQNKSMLGRFYPLIK